MLLVFQKLIAALEGGNRGFAFASGLAAISTVLMSFQQGDHLIVSEDIYGGTYRALTQVFSRWQLQVTFVDSTDLQAVSNAIRPSTKAIYLETPSNPLLKISDLKGIIKISQNHGLLTIVDNTFLTPYFCRPLELGADIVVHSATKFLNGHSDVVAGLVVAKNEEVAQTIGFLQNSLGAVLGPYDSWLLIRGIKTLGVRLEKQTQNAQVLAEWLQEQTWVKKVVYPGLKDHPRREILHDTASGDGAVVSFEVRDEEVLNKVLRQLSLPAVAVSLGAVESILTHPATMSHASMPKEQRAKLGISDHLLRLSVGLEDPLDLIQDFEKVTSLGEYLDSSYF